MSNGKKTMVFNFTNDRYITNCTIEIPTEEIKVIGRAKCNPKDSFSQRKGETIAIIRAMIKIYKKLLHNLNKEIKLLEATERITYPKKLIGFGVDETHRRFSTVLEEKYKQKEQYEKDMESYKNDLINLFQREKDFMDKVNKKREKAKNSPTILEYVKSYRKAYDEKQKQKK